MNIKFYNEKYCLTILFWLPLVMLTIAALSHGDMLGNLPFIKYSYQTMSNIIPSFEQWMLYSTVKGHTMFFLVMGWVFVPYYFLISIFDETKENKYLEYCKKKKKSSISNFISILIVSLIFFCVFYFYYPVEEQHCIYICLNEFIFGQVFYFFALMYLLGTIFSHLYWSIKYFGGLK